MRFLLITSARRELVKVWVCQETSPVGSLLPPVDLASVASTIRHNGHEARISDLRLAGNPAKAYREVLANYEPDAVVLNLSTTGAEHDYALLRATPEQVKRVCFGTHAQAMRAEAFQKGVDFILLGDPEAAMSSLIDNQLLGDASDGVLTPDRSEKEPHLWSDLDTLPFPALDLLDLDRYHSSIIRRGKPFTLLLGSRGCPYACTYCLYPVLFGGKYRRRSVGNIVDEMEEDYREHGIRAFYFLDATFNVKESRVEEFAGEILSRGLDVDWSCNMRVAPVSPAMLSLMKQAGCDWIFYGVEDQDFIREIRKNTSKEATIKAFRLTKEAGISTVAFLMVFPRTGLDEKTYAKNMLSVLQTLKADAFQCNISIPFPGTEMWRQALAKDEADRRWSLYDPHGEVLPYESPVDLVDVKRRIYRGFLLSHPIRTLKAARRMDLRALAATSMTFTRRNLMPWFLHEREKANSHQRAGPSSARSPPAT
jgi:anaerobic magnesium-protoporphyrin IX monomethyl ester cyclase